MIPHPVEIRYLEAPQLLRIEFSDAVVIDYPTPLLRGFCPCARCQGHGGGPPTWTPVVDARAYVIENVSGVGTYGLCIVWGDGHDTGIYTFELLRRIEVSGFDSAAMTPQTELPVRAS